MTTVRALRIIRWTALGLIGLILLGTVVFLEFGPKGEPRVVADNATPGTMAVAGASISGSFNLIDHKGRAVRMRPTGVAGCWCSSVTPIAPTSAR